MTQRSAEQADGRSVGHERGERMQYRWIQAAQARVMEAAAAEDGMSTAE